MSIQATKEEVKNWDKTQQADLMHFLEGLPTDDKFEMSDNWKKEWNKRMEALKNGSSLGRPARDVVTKYVAQ